MSNRLKEKVTWFFKAKKYIPVLILIGLVIILSFAIKGPRKEASVSEVKEAIEKEGYIAYDCMEIASDNFEDLKQAIGFEKEDRFFIFFVFNDDAPAAAAFASYVSYVRLNHNAPQHREIDTYYSNYTVYTLGAKGDYYAVVRVGNTLVYASAPDDDRGDICNIIRSINYFDD